MSKHNDVHDQEQELAATELEEIDSDSLDIADSDVGFLLDKDGNLKTVFGPAAGFENPSENVAAILAILGIDQLTAPNRTLH